MDQIKKKGLAIALDVARIYKIDLMDLNFSTEPPWGLVISPFGTKEFFKPNLSAFRVRLIVQLEGIVTPALWRSLLLVDTLVWEKHCRCYHYLIEMILCRLGSMIGVGYYRGARDLERNKSGLLDRCCFSHLKSHYFFKKKKNDLEGFTNGTSVYCFAPDFLFYHNLASNGNL